VTVLAVSGISIAFTSAIVLTAVYGLIAVGFVIVYRASGVLNFAHGAMMVLGGFLGFSIVDHLGLSAVAGYPLVALAGFAIGWAFYLLVMPRLAGQPVWVPVLVTTGIGFFLAIGLIGMIWKLQIQTFGGSLGFADSAHRLPGGILLTTIELILVAAFVAVEVALIAFYRFSKLGIQMRAAAHDHHLAAYRSINIHLVFGLAWGLATAIAMFTGFAYATEHTLDVNNSVIALKAFAAAMVGGMDSIAGVFFGALIVGVSEGLAEVYVSSSVADLLPFLVLFVVLLIRPWGLMGSAELIDRV
jgi:branched-chain amino acid transport system permease protein